MEKEAEHVCVLCCQDTYLFAVGKCDHPVCYLCSTKMRVLCKQKHCAICRVELDKVVFVRELQPFAVLNDHAYQAEKKHGIYFASGRIFAKFRRIFRTECPQCPESKAFSKFEHLEQHMRKQHNLFCCELCVKYLKMFPSERKWYNPEELARHRTQGDADDTSHCGHPLCTFCNTRYLDKDELYKHLRLDHYFCHFCDADRAQDYYNEYHNLREHFRERHFLCEEGLCSTQQFTNAFMTEIAYKAHKAAAHSKNRAEARQNRQINYAPRQEWAAAIQSSQAARRQAERGQVHERWGRKPVFPVLGAAAPPPPVFLKEDDFPRLGHCGTMSSAQIKPSYAESTRKYLSFQEENFPALIPQKPQENMASAWSQVQNKPDVLNSKLVVIPKETQAHGAPVFSSSDPRPSSPVPLAPAPRRMKKHVLPKGKSPVSSDDGDPQTGKMVQEICAVPNPSDISSLPTVKTGLSQPNNKKGTSANNVEMVTTVAHKENVPKTKLPDCNVLKGTVAPKSDMFINEYKEKPKDTKDPVLPEEPSVPKKQPVFEPPAVPEEENFCALITKKPPPGFESTFSLKNIHMVLPPPPPGFGPVICKPPPGFTGVPLTSNVAECTVAVMNTPASSTGTYPMPEIFKQRNMDLIQSIQSFLQNDESKFNELKNYSVQFRLGSITAAQYHKSCHELLGENFSKVFCELLVLLPDPHKQQELLTAHLDFKATEKQKSGSKFKKNKKTKLTSNVAECTVPVMNRPVSSTGTYPMPEIFKQRNMDLIQSIQSFLQNDESKFNELKNYSVQFRLGSITAAQYHKSCHELLGENFSRVFCELLVLLPDPHKQQELLTAHVDFKATEKQKSGVRSKKFVFKNICRLS